MMGLALPPLLPLLLRCFSARAHWQIESALEFHPLYCKEDLVLFSTSYDPVFLFSLHRIARDRERCDEGGV